MSEIFYRDKKNRGEAHLLTSYLHDITIENGKTIAVLHISPVIQD